MINERRNPYIEIFYYRDLVDDFYKDLLDIVNQVYDEFLKKNLDAHGMNLYLRKLWLNFIMRWLLKYPFGKS